MVQFSGMSPMNLRPKIWRAVLVAPLGAPLSISVVTVAETTLKTGLSGLGDLPMLTLFVFLFGLPFAYGVMLLLGLPYLIWLRSRGWLAWTSVCVGATVLGAVTWAGYWSLSLSPLPLISTVPAGGLIGFIVGVIFSALAELPKRIICPDPRAGA